ncbi:hypothetical protein BMS3Bbin03_00730 [bacterium BMS3Bbin03]|nr:hypothetical protein BMS3Bbin03_00730 [bacterium BMS3Bbin03]
MDKDKLKKAYNKFIEKLELDSFHTIKCNYFINTEVSGIKKNVRIQIISSEELIEREEWNQEKFAARAIYSVIGRKGKKIFFRIDTVNQFYFSTEVPITQELFELFCEFSFQAMAWPYFREMVANASIRMGLPLLQIPLLKRIPRKVDKGGSE